MKRTKKLYILLGVLVVICIATFALSKTEKKKENIKNSDKTVLEVDSDSVNKISWKSSLGSLAFEKKDGTWTYTDDANFPVDQDKIAERLKLFKEFGVTFEIEDVDDYGQYGLDDPECTITLETDDETYEILLGDYSTMDSQRYVSIGDGNVYLVKNDPMDSFNVTIDALVKNDEIPNFNQVEKISEIKVSGSTSLDAKYKENDGLSDNEDDIYFVNKDKEEQPLDTNLVKTYLNNVNALNLGTYVTYNATDDKFTICAVGRVIPEKGFLRLTSICEHMVEDGRDFTLNIVGDGKEYDRLKEMVESHHLEKWEHLIGFQENPYPYIKNADLFVCSSLNEGYNLAISEAVILGVPVISTDCSGIKENLGNGKWGYIVENRKETLYHAISRCFDEPGFLEELKKKSEAGSIQDTYEGRLKKIESIIEGVVN